MTKPQQAKLDDLSQALKKRQLLNLDIKGAAFQLQDWPVIREDALYEQLKKRRAAEINKGAIKKYARKMSSFLIRTTSVC